MAAYDMSFAGKVALMTGGASGIGLATAEAFAEAGAAVVIADVSQEQATAAAEMLKVNGRKVIGLRCDVL